MTDISVKNACVNGSRSYNMSN